MDLCRAQAALFDVRFLGGTLTAELVLLRDVKQMIGYLRGHLSLELEVPQRLNEEEEEKTLIETADFSAVCGHHDVKRALEFSAAGGHHVLMSGPLGCGKSMLADAFHTIVPNLLNEEMLENRCLCTAQFYPFSTRIPLRPSTKRTVGYGKRTSFARKQA